MSQERPIPLLSDEDATPEVRALFERIQNAIGFVPNLFRLWGNAPHLVETLVQLEVTVAGSGKVPSYLKELAMTRVSELNGCPYCKAFHSHNLRELGADDSKRDALSERHPPPSSLFGEDELFVIKLADEMTLSVRASDETLWKARQLFGLDGAVELMATISLLNFDNRMAFSAGVEPDKR